MGWPRTNEVMRLYREKDGSYFLLAVDHEDGGTYDAVANVHEGPRPSLCGTTITRSWMAATRPKRVEWDELPSEWKEAFSRYMGDDEPFQPLYVRGFWRMSNTSRIKGA